MNFHDTANLYNLTSTSKGQIHRASDSELEAFTLKLKSFEQEVGEDAQEPYWQTKIRLLKRYRFRICALPLPCNHSVDNDIEGLQRVSQELSKCNNVYPQYAEAAHQLIHTVQSLTLMSINPLLDKILELDIDNRTNTALLIKESRFVEPLEAFLSTILALRHLHIVTAPQLRRGSTFEQLIILGPMRWFPDYVFTAPRAANWHVVRYTFLGDGWKPRVTFLQQEREKFIPKMSFPSNISPESEIVNAEEVLPSIDFDAISTQISRQQSNNQELVEGKLVILENNCAICLEKDSSELVINTQSSEVIHRIKIEKLEPNLFLIVREQNSRDYIAPLANRLLGERAVPARDAQEHWKSELRKAVARKGIQPVLNGLKQMGAKSASEQNVRNWMSSSERKIRPRYIEDFHAIMNYLNIADRTKDYWKKARQINQAHHRAGIEIKKLLLAEVRKSNLDQLEQRGYQSFALNKYETNIQAYRIVDIQRESISVPLSKIGEILEL